MFDLEVITSQVFTKYMNIYSWDVEWIFYHSLIRKTETILGVAKKGNLTQGIGQGGDGRLGSTRDSEAMPNLATAGSLNIPRLPAAMQGRDVLQSPRAGAFQQSGLRSRSLTHGGRGHLEEANPQWRCSCFRNATKSGVQRKKSLAFFLPSSNILNKLDKHNWKPEAGQWWEMDVPQIQRGQDNCGEWI